ncbi:MAG TPA: HAMP domain-containing sensor histidine kinase [Gemmatimonadaceae bacterium]|nr:HAMP domain-containing sensor histidine kinase [Gemmatimonadaceae bacterium]
MSDITRRYGIALLTSGATIGVVVLLARLLPFEPFLLFAVPVALTSRYAGRGPTALTVVLMVTGIEATLILSTGRFRFSVTELWLHAAIFGVVAFAIDSTTEALRKARRDAERSAARLEDFNVELEQQMEEIQRLSDHLHQTNLSLARARDVAEDASRAREEMLGVVAHDLRNPLNLVMMTTQLVADTAPSGERRDQLLGVIRRAAQRMNRLIEDLLEVVRQESGKIRLDVGDVSAASVLAQTAEMFYAAAAEKGISLRVEDPPPGLAVRADSERIMQVLSNLVGNALKFVARGGSVLLKCELRGTEAVFAVVDSGPGIAGEDQSRLFEKFWQRRRSDTRGVGLGLSIARGIVEAHGGRIWVESKIGDGSTFYFSLPAVTERNEESPLATVASAEDGGLWT